MALVQEAAPAAVHGELVVEAVGEAAAGAQLPTSHCCCGILLQSSTIVTSSVLHSGHLDALGWGLGGEWQLVLGGGRQPGPGRARPGARDVAGGRVAGQKHGQHQ